MIVPEGTLIYLRVPHLFYLCYNSVNVVILIYKAWDDKLNLFQSSGKLFYWVGFLALQNKLFIKVYSDTRKFLFILDFCHNQLLCFAKVSMSVGMFVISILFKYSKEVCLQYFYVKRWRCVRAVYIHWAFKFWAWVQRADDARFVTIFRIL